MMIVTGPARNLFLLTTLATIFVLGCSVDENDQLTAVGYSEGGVLYCVTASGSQVNIADILEGGECGEDFARQGDLYNYIGSGSGFSAPPKDADCVTQVAYRLSSVSLGDPTFLFIAHSLAEEEFEIRKADDSTIERRALRTDSTCLIDFWILSDAKEGDMFQIRFGEHTIPITVGDITSRGGGGGVRSLSPIGDEVLIGT